MENGHNNIESFVELDMQFHLTVAKATHNHLVETILATVITIFEPFIKKSIIK